MTTIITIEQGGTGVQTVQELKEVLELKQSAFLNKSDNIDDDSHELLSTAYVVNQLAKKIEAGLDPSNIVPIEKGGTGADNAADAIRNLGIQNTSVTFPIQIENGGTGAINSEMALKNLGLNIPVPVSVGGTGATNSIDALKNLGLDIPVPVSVGGTGATNSIDALKNLGLDIPVPVSDGGTGATNLEEVVNNLYLNNFVINELTDDDDLNKKNFAGLYIYEPLNSIKLPTNTPPDIDPDIKKFVLLVLSSISKLPGNNLNDYENSENNRGIATQLFFVNDVQNKKNNMNEIYIRSLSRSPSDIGTDKTVWSTWTRINSSKTTTISSGSPSGGKNGDIWIQYIN